MFNKPFWFVPIALISALVLAVSVSAQEGRSGAWVDEIIFTEEANPQTAVTRLRAGEIDLFAFSASDADLLRTVEADPNLDYTLSYGSYVELTFNVAGPVFSRTGKLNPFAVKEIREAMNWLVDREHVVDEIFRGMAVPRYTPISTFLPDYARAAEAIRAIELKYSHDFERAEAVISREMEKLGARKENGVWRYNGEPVEIIVLIRIEDERRALGDYVATLLEEIGFVVDRQYKTATEAPPLWLGDPNDGLFHIYTNSWLSTAVHRDSGSIFESQFTPRGNPYTLWLHYNPDPRLDELADRLARGDFASMEERAEMMSEALDLAIKDSARIYIADRSIFAPRRADLQVTADLAGGIPTTPLWPHTIRYKDRIGGVVNIGAMAILTTPWNPIAGTSWSYDLMVGRATGDPSMFYNPFTGLPMPHRIERAEVVVEEGLPVIKSSDWVDLEFVPEIRVPGDVWAEWDPVEQRFITVAEKFPEGITARRKSVVYYPEDLYAKVKWHDGSPISPADFVMGMILTFDPGYEASPIFDKTSEAVLDALLSMFKGVKIRSTEPLVIETYMDSFDLDAEANVVTWFPYYRHGPGAWHNVGLGVRAEAHRELAFSAPKADELGVEWTNYIAGPSLAVLARHLSEARSSAYIPYEPTLGRFVSDDEVRARWENLAKWHEEKGHFWIGTGPFFLERVYPVEKILHLKRNPDYPDPAGRWDQFAEPMIADVEVFGERRVRIGGDAAFEVDVTFRGEPYPSGAISEVKYLVINGRGELVLTGSAQEVGDGWYQIALGEDETSLLAVGANRLEVVVVSELVSVPSFASFQFVSTR